MEELGIGRPSTYAMIIDTIQTRGYVELVDKTFKPTESGILTSDRLTQFFNDIINVEYTAQMEKELDDIAEGQDDYFDAIDTFIKKFNLYWMKQMKKWKSFHLKNRREMS